MKRFVINVLSPDQPGIICKISEGIIKVNGNILEMSQTVVSNYFTDIIIAEFPEGIKKKQIEQEILTATQRFNTKITIDEYEEKVKKPKATTPFILTASGPKEIKIIYRLTRYLSAKEINIEDLYIKENKGDFLIVSELSIPSTLDIYYIQTELENIAKEFGFKLLLQHEDIFKATNEIKFY